MASRTPRRSISPERRSLYAVGIGMQVVGGVGFLVCFFGFAIAGKSAVDTFPGRQSNPMGFWVGAGVCLVLAVVGQWLSRIAARGIAGSGMVLDPERARDDLEPWARMGGGLLKDAIEEGGLARRDGGEAKARVVVRCKKCHALNDEKAKFCDQCGAGL